MGARGSKRLVVDASVARAAGGEQATYPLSKRSRDFLKAMLAAGHHAVLSRPIRDEWKKHASIFASQWRTAMMARKRVILDDVPEDPTLRQAIEEAATTENGRRAMLKDVHLLEAARVTDESVASLDDVVRALFARASRRVRPLRSVVWVNPGREEEDSVGWLEKGAPKDTRRRLGEFEG